MPSNINRNVLTLEEKILRYVQSRFPELETENDDRIKRFIDRNYGAAGVIKLISDTLEEMFEK